MLTLQINGQSRTLDLAAPATLAQVLHQLGLKPDRVAVEHNATIVARPAWAETSVAPGDRLEIVHFVGGGVPEGKSPKNPAQRSLNSTTIQNMCYRT